jgi:O-antigen/teichoic acid export membrane protein
MSVRLHDIATTFAARIVAMIGPFIVSIITARVLGPEDRGRLFLVLAIAQIGAQVANLGLQSSNTYLIAKRHELIGPIFTNSLLVSVVATPPVTLLIALAAGWPEALGLQVFGASLGPLALVSVIIAPILVISLYVNNLAIGVGQVQLFNGMTIGYSAASVVITSIVAVTGASISLFLLASLVALAIPTVIGARRLLAGVAINIRFDVELFRSGFAFAVRAYLATMFGFIMTRVGAFALQRCASLDEVGQFSVAMQLSDGLIMLPSTVGILLFPELVKARQGQRLGAMWRVFWGLGTIMLIVSAGFYVCAPWLVALMFGPSFAGATEVLRALLPSVLMIALTSVISQYLAAEGFPWIQVIAWLIGMMLQASLSYWAAGKWGGVGVALCFAATNAVVLFALLAEVFRRKTS